MIPSAEVLPREGVVALLDHGDTGSAGLLTQWCHDDRPLAGTRQAASNTS